MSLKLVRVDDRLIHGQVVLGWAPALNAEQILLIDDHVSSTEWEQELYRMGVPPRMDVEFTSVANAPEALARWAESPRRTIVMMADVETLRRVCQLTEAVTRVNIGGVHEGVGRKKRLPYVFLTEEEGDSLKQLSEKGIEVTARDVPTAKPVPLKEFV